TSIYHIKPVYTPLALRDWFRAAPRNPLKPLTRLRLVQHRADRPRIDAWQTIVNGRLGLHDPNAPENRRALVTPSALPET
ncbi:hypothetical protein MXL30_24040, partial [Enterobacter kobei]|nr:hypothetical protein [Enterobacter kobei]MEB7617414.1 hypothetical protein [Klebsiella michiganensis]